MTGLFFANHRTSMPADVVQGMDGTILGADDDDDIRVHAEREKIARPRDLAGMSGKQPARAPDPVQVEAVRLVARVKFPRQRPARRTRGDQRFDSAWHGLTGEEPAASRPFGQSPV